MGREDPAEGFGDPGEDAEGAGEQPAGSDRAASPEKTRHGRGVTAFEISRALTASGGNRSLAAAALGISPEQLGDRIKKHAQLKALWGKAGMNDAGGPPPPREAEVMNRGALVLPASEPGTVELAQMVEQGDRELQEKGLRELGVSEDLLKRLKGLEGLARSSGHFIAISLETTHRSYYLQVLELMELANGLRKRLMAKGGEDGYIVDDEARAFFNKNYIEMVKEAGRAYELMLTGAQAMIKMIADTKDMEMPGGKKKKHGWDIVQANPATSGGKPPLPPPPD